MINDAAFRTVTANIADTIATIQNAPQTYCGRLWPNDRNTVRRLRFPACTHKPNDARRNLSTRFSKLEEKNMNHLRQRRPGRHQLIRHLITIRADI
ncbi:hypothetical protein AVEN_2771-1 [Araneus ventricosus]|uniref:Uncharacterized protein n=1 Tax=Araneus ventricosus TaxID=182803 RepID=A0A4Y2X824_ARAVE|nr:hypothetical protein AVEN_2771-1 [Araneus ventricosus]